MSEASEDCLPRLRGPGSQPTPARPQAAAALDVASGQQDAAHRGKSSKKHGKAMELSGTPVPCRPEASPVFFCHSHPATLKSQAANAPSLNRQGYIHTTKINSGGLGTRGPKARACGEHAHRFARAKELPWQTSHVHNGSTISHAGST